MPGVIDVRIKALERQIENIKGFITQPKGVFETIDSMVKTFRLANQSTLRQLGISIPPVAGQAMGPGIVQSILRRGSMLERIRKGKILPISPIQR